MSRERVVFDTNVLISALLSGTSVPARALESALTHDQLIASTATVHELVLKLFSTKFDRYLSWEQRHELLVRLSPLVELIEVVEMVRASRDPKDDKFLEAAINGKADLLVSGDRDLLELHPFRGIAILTPSDYLRRQEHNR